MWISSNLTDDPLINDAMGWSEPVSLVRHGVVLAETCPCAACAAGGLNEAAGDGLSSLDGSKAVWTTEQVVSNFLRANSAWTPGSTIAFSFREAAPPGADSDFSFVRVAENERELTRLGFELISDLINLTFVEAPDDYQSTGTGRRIYFSKDASAPEYEWGHATRYTLPEGSGRRITSAEVIMSSEAVAQRQWFAGGYNFQALMHEMLHTLGIPHPGNYNANGNPITYAANAEYAQDSRQFTVMSYFAAANTGADHTVDSKAGVYSGATPLLHDVAALQALYGANMNTRTGDTVYGYNSTAGRTPFDFTVNTTPIFTVWDAGGRDKLDFSQSNFAVNLNLNAGAFSDAFEMTNNISIALGVVIEDGTTGGGDDRLVGNDAGNLLQAGAGADDISARGGDDRLEGGDGDDSLGGDAGADVVDGGAGRDRLFGGGDGDQVFGGDGDDVIFGEDGDDTIVAGQGDDYLDGGAGRDLVLAEAGADIVRGLDGDDRLEGQDGDDLMFGGAGRDRLEGGFGRDSLFGETEADDLSGGLDDDRVHGQDGDDAMGGGEGNDYLDGGAGRDLMFGEGGADMLVGGLDGDTLYGQDGDDLILAQEGDDALFGGNGRDALYGEDGADLLVGDADDDRLHGGAGDDMIGGQDGADYLEGGGGRDTLFGDAGDDLIFGGDGGDALWGQGGADRFLFAALGESTDAGRDRIHDFDARAGDRVDLGGIDADIFADGNQAFRLVGGFSGRAGEAVLGFDAGSNITVLSLDVNGDGGADFRLDITGDARAADGFIL